MRDISQYQVRAINRNWLTDNWGKELFIDTIGEVHGHQCSYPLHKRVMGTFQRKDCQALQPLSTHEFGVHRYDLPLNWDGTINKEKVI